MTRSRGVRIAVLCAWLAASGCMTLHEVPPGEYARRPERKAVRVETREGLVYDFDYATFAADTLTGYRSRPDVEGPVDQMAMFRIPFDDVQRLTTHGLDWRRTGMVGGTVVAAALAIGLAHKNASDNSGDNSTGGGKAFTGN